MSEFQQTNQQLDPTKQPAPAELAGLPAIPDGILQALLSIARSIGGNGQGVTGMVTAYAGANAPLGYLLCNGQAVSRTVYASLFALLGTAYGVGNGTTTFNVPDLRGRVPVGKDAGTFPTLGGAGGEQTHLLTTAEMPSHTHPTTNFAYYTGAAGQITFTGTANGNFATDTGAAGGGGAHNNIQPYQVVNYIIKV